MQSSVGAAVAGQLPAILENGGRTAALQSGGGVRTPKPDTGDILVD
jgi:hypothetical protein